MVGEWMAAMEKMETEGVGEENGKKRGKGERKKRLKTPSFWSKTQTSAVEGGGGTRGEDRRRKKIPGYRGNRWGGMIKMYNI